MDDLPPRFILGADNPPDEGPDEWLKYLQLDDGKAIPNLANAATALRQAPELVGMLAFDEMQCHVMVTRSLPKSRMARVTKRRWLTDADVSAIQEFLQRNDLRRMSRDTVHQACDMIARESSYHPVKQYLNSVRWDRIPRIDTWLATYLGCENSEYNIGIGRMFLISMVARIMEPGTKCDYMIILEDDRQGTKKSSACAILGGEWFSDGLPDLHGNSNQVRISMHIRGKWLIEISDLSSFNRAESETLKAFISRREEQFTPLYGRNEVKEPRQNVFIGTTNKSAYLHDDTGGRRFWPTKTGDIDLDGLARDRDQLFAEAVRLYQARVNWWPEPTFEARWIKPQQEARYEVDEWESPILEKTRSGMTITEIANQCLGLGTDKLGTGEQRRIRTILTRNGWTPGTRTTGKRPWLPPAET